MKISAVMPVFNTDPKYIFEAVQSILTQNYNIYEFIIVNDGSDRSETLGVLNQIQKAYLAGIRVEHHFENKGIPGALNTGIRVMKGDWFAGCSSDDRWLPNKTEEHVKFVKSNPKAKAMYSDWEFINDE